MTSTSPITHEEIEARAHNVWEQCGRPEGCELAHWFRAERELQKEREQAEGFRAGLAEAEPLPDTAGHQRHG